MIDAERIALLEDALDHIARVARNSMTQSKRDRWIQIRAERAIQGLPFIMAALPPYPHMRIQKLEKEIERLKADK